MLIRVKSGSRWSRLAYAAREQKKKVPENGGKEMTQLLVEYLDEHLEYPADTRLVIHQQQVGTDVMVMKKDANVSILVIWTKDRK